MIFDKLSPTDHMFEPLPSSFIEHPLSDECNFSQIELSKQKMVSTKEENSTNNMYAITTNRYHRLKPSPLNLSSLSTENITSTTTNQSLQQIEQTIMTNVDEGSTNSLWQSSDNHHLPISSTKSLSMSQFYPNSSMTSYSSSSSSSSDLSLINSDPHHGDKSEIKTLSSSSSSGYESPLNSVSDHFFPSSPDSIIISDCSLIEQYINLHLQKQLSFEHDITSSSPLSLSSSSSSFFSHDLISTIDSPSYCRKYLIHNQLSSDTDDDSQATTISTNVLPLQKEKKRPRSLPIAIQQPKGSI